MDSVPSGVLQAVLRTTGHWRFHGIAAISRLRQVDSGKARLLGYLEHAQSAAVWFDEGAPAFCEINVLLPAGRSICKSVSVCVWYCYISPTGENRYRHHMVIGDRTLRVPSCVPHLDYSELCFGFIDCWYE